MIFIEKMGDRPAWMKIKKYRAEGRRAELVLSLRKKDYWFPVSPSVYERFRGKISESRLDGLRYLQRYIRQYRGYAGKWPSKRYERLNKISDTLLESESISGSIMRLFQEGHKLFAIAQAVSLPVPIVEQFLKVTGHRSDIDGI